MLNLRRHNQKIPNGKNRNSCISSVCFNAVDLCNMHVLQLLPIARIVHQFIRGCKKANGGSWATGRL